MRGKANLADSLQENAKTCDSSFALATSITELEAALEAEKKRC